MPWTPGWTGPGRDENRKRTGSPGGRPGSRREDEMTKTAFVVVAYMAVWSGLAVYVAALARRQARVSRRVETLARRVEGEGGGPCTS